jgi:hypothetical protein
MFLVTVVHFNSYPQLFQLFNLWFQHHIYSWTRSFWTRYDETKEHELKLIQRDGGRLYDTTKMGQQEYGVEFVLNGSKPSIANLK